MNNQSGHDDGNITLNFSGQLVLTREALEEIIRRMTPKPSATARGAAAFDKIDERGGLPRLAYTVKETAQMLGVCYFTVYRLIQRGFLRSSGATRTKLIPKKEIERFLNSTMSEH